MPLPDPHTCASNPTTEAQKQAIFDLRTRGWSIERIARKLGKSTSTVSYWCLSMGAEPEGRGPILPPAWGIRLRNGQPVLPFAPQEDAVLLAASAEGASYAEMSRRLPGRTQGSCRYRLYTLARRDEYGVASPGGAHA